MHPSLKDYQHRLANGAVGPTTLRNQGSRNVTKRAREFLRELNPQRLVCGSDEEFQRELDRQTKRLLNRFPVPARKSWGAARKAINLFLADAYHHRFISAAYRMDKIVDFLEVPLDSLVGKHLAEQSKKESGRCLKRWPGLKHLKPEDNKAYQDFARDLAKRKGWSRVHLDVVMWGR